MSADGDTAVVGAPLHDAGGTDAGAAYVFRRGATSWSQEAKLMPASLAAGDEFGSGVAVSGDTIIVSAPKDDGLGTDAGILYVFTRTGAVWSEQAQVGAPDAVPGHQLGGAGRGQTIDLEGDVAVVGAPGASAVYVFARTGTQWSFDDKLTEPGVSGLGRTVEFDGEKIFASGFSTGIYAFVLEECSMDAECGSGFCRDGFCCDTTCGGGLTDDCLGCAQQLTGLPNGQCGVIPAGEICRPDAGRPRRECGLPGSQW